MLLNIIGWQETHAFDDDPKIVFEISNSSDLGSAGDTLGPQEVAGILGEQRFLFQFVARVTHNSEFAVLVKYLLLV